MQLLFHFLPLLSLASLAFALALALPYQDSSLEPASHHLKRQYCPTTNTTTTHPWTLSQFCVFTANPGPDGISWVSFYFLDGNDRGLVQCGKAK